MVALASVGCTGFVEPQPQVPSVVTDLPCDVEALMAKRCWTCHGQSPVAGAPALTSVAAFMAPSQGDPTQTIGALAVARMQSTSAMMPPPPATPASAAEISALGAWVGAGYAGETGCGPICTSGTTWQGGDRESPLMNPGMACINCHSGGEGPRFSIAGTIYPTVHEPDLCNGAPPAGSLQIVITGADGKALKSDAQRRGQLLLRGAGRAAVSGQGDRRRGRTRHGDAPDQRRLQPMPHPGRGNRRARTGSGQELEVIYTATGKASLPFAEDAFLLDLLVSQARKSGSPEVTFDSLRALIDFMGVSDGGSDYKRLRQRIERIMGLHIRIERKDAVRVNVRVVDVENMEDIGSKRPQLLEGAHGQRRLLPYVFRFAPEFYDDLMRHYTVIPLDFLKAFSGSPIEDSIARWLYRRAIHAESWSLVNYSDARFVGCAVLRVAGSDGWLRQGGERLGVFWSSDGTG